VIEAQPDMPLVGAVSLHVALLTFVLRVHVDRLDYVDQVLVNYSYSCSFLLLVALVIVIESNWQRHLVSVIKYRGLTFWWMIVKLRL